MSQDHLDTLSFSHEMYDQAARAMAFQVPSLNLPAAGGAGGAEEWQRDLRAKLVELLGDFPDERCELLPRITETKEFPTYTREMVLFQSRPNMTVFGYLLLPKNFDPPGPAILCLHGHGRGVDDIVGIQEDGTMRTEYGEYQNDFALQCVDHGYAALAIEQFGFGHRRDDAACQRGSGNSSCQPSSGAAFLLGQTMIGWRVYDAMRSLDYLSTRSEIDMNRIGVMGISGGGTTTFYSAAIDERFKVAVVSGYFNTYRDSILSISHCIDNYIPGILKYAEMYDIAGLIAPRAMFVESGTEDTIFPIDATRFAFNQAQEIFRVFGVEDQLGLEVFEAAHSFHGVGAFRFLDQKL